MTIGGRQAVCRGREVLNYGDDGEDDNDDDGEADATLAPSLRPALLVPGPSRRITPEFITGRVQWQQWIFLWP
jgi:hypothetical protein